MKKWPLRIINYLTGTLILSSLHCLVVALVNGGNAMTLLYSMIYLPVVIMLSESQKRAKYFWQFAAFAVVAVTVVRVVYNGSFEQTLSTVLTVAAALFYFYARAKDIECPLEAPTYPVLGLFIIMYFLERQYPSELLKNYAVIGAGIYCLLCMYKTNLDEIFMIIDLNGTLERFPERRLLQSNLVMMGFQTIIVGGGMGMILSTGVDGLLNKIMSVIRRFFLWLLHFLESDAQHGGSEVVGGGMEMPVVEATERSALMEMILQILEILSVIIVIALTVYFVYRILKKLYQLYLEFDMNSAENGDEIERIYVTQTKEKKLKKQKSENLFWDRTPNARIRKYYKKRVLRDRKEKPKAYMTPEEIEKGVEMSVDKKEVFHTLYEQARYGNVDCSKEDVENMLKS